MKKFFIAPADLAPPLRAHHGQGKNNIIINPSFKVFCRAFCKKLAAGGIRVPDKLPQGVYTFGMQNLKYTNKGEKYVLYTFSRVL